MFFLLFLFFFLFTKRFLTVRLDMTDARVSTSANFFFMAITTTPTPGQVEIVVATPAELALAEPPPAPAPRKDEGSRPASQEPSGYIFFKNVFLLYSTVHYKKNGCDQHPTPLHLGLPRHPSNDEGRARDAST